MEPHEIAVIARTKAHAQRFYQALLSAGVPAKLLDADGPVSSGVQVGAMHRVKGLEYRIVYLVACSASVVPQPFYGEESGAAREDHEERERRLLYVAMTRAREDLRVSGAAPLSVFL